MSHLDNWGMYHVILRDELGDEFSVELAAKNVHDAWDKIALEYSESCVVHARKLKPYDRED